MGMPNKEQIKKVLKDLGNVEGTLALDPRATALDKFRWELHQKFVKYLREKKITQRKLAEILEIDEGKVSKILHHRLEEFSTDRLITLYQKLNPQVKLKVS
jgi:predicted XRE-type DNA-binding protein